MTTTTEKFVESKLSKHKMHFEKTAETDHVVKPMKFVNMFKMYVSYLVEVMLS